MTAGLAALLSLAGIAFSYNESPCWINEYLLFDVAENTVRAQTEQMGALQAEHEQALIAQCQTEAYRQERERHSERIVPRLYGSMDAAKVRIEPRPKKGEAKEAPRGLAGYESLVLVRSRTGPTSPAFGPSSCQSRAGTACLTGQAPAVFQLILPPPSSSANCCGLPVASVMRISVQNWSSWGTGRSGFGTWSISTTPRRSQIVDWFHAEEHLEGVAQAAFSDPSPTHRLVGTGDPSLWDGQLEE